MAVCSGRRTHDGMSRESEGFCVQARRRMRKQLLDVRLQNDDSTGALAQGILSMGEPSATRPFPKYRRKMLIRITL